MLCRFSRVSSKFRRETNSDEAVTPFSAHCISDHRISDQNVRTVMVRTRVRVRVRVRGGDAVVRNAVGRKVGNPMMLVNGVECCL